MGTIKTTNIEPIATNGTVTLGSSGDTFTVPSGVTVNMSSATQTGVGGVNTPAFKARLSSDQTIANGTDTTIACNTEKFDTAGCYNNTGSTVTLNGISTPAYSFAPNVAGKYFVYGGARFTSTSGSGTLAYVLLQKNGTNSFLGISDFVPYVGQNVGGIVEMNGSSDTLKLTVYQNSGGSKTIVGSSSDVDDVANFGAFKIIE